jgi:hypothetical protein
MTPDIEALARRALACKGWRWMPGMRLHQGGWFARVGDGWEWDDSKGPILPDLSDPLTVQAVLLLAREAWGCDWLTCQPLLTEGGIHGWRVVGTSAPSGRTEAEALVAALEAAT